MSKKQTVLRTGLGTLFIGAGLNPIARWAATIMLAGTLPAAIDQLRNPEVTEKLGIPTSVVALRIPAQVLVIIGAWYATRKSR